MNYLQRHKQGKRKCSKAVVTPGDRRGWGGSPARGTLVKSRGVARKGGHLSGAVAFLKGHSWPRATVQTGVQGHKYPDHILFSPSSQSLAKKRTLEDIHGVTSRQPCRAVSRVEKGRDWMRGSQGGCQHSTWCAQGISTQHP